MKVTDTTVFWPVTLNRSRKRIVCSSNVTRNLMISNRKTNWERMNVPFLRPSWLSRRLLAWDHLASQLEPSQQTRPKLNSWGCDNKTTPWRSKLKRSTTYKLNSSPRIRGIETWPRNSLKVNSGCSTLVMLIKPRRFSRLDRVRESRQGMLLRMAHLVKMAKLVSPRWVKSRPFLCPMRRRSKRKLTSWSNPRRRTTWSWIRSKVPKMRVYRPRRTTMRSSRSRWLPSRVPWEEQLWRQAILLRQLH